jgi:predicted transcriptional regulator
MAFELKDLKEIRRKLGITQTELARKSGVSQSLIAKIESGRLDPTYTKANKIIEALESETSVKEQKAEDIMNKKVISVSPETDIKEATKLMKKYEISQLPVIEKDNLVGMVSETTILDALISQKKEYKVAEIMSDAPPVISPKTNVSVISNLLKFCPMLIVSEKGKIIGLITKSDLIRIVYA